MFADNIKALLIVDDIIIHKILSIFLHCYQYKLWNEIQHRPGFNVINLNRLATFTKVIWRPIPSIPFDHNVYIAIAV